MPVTIKKSLVKYKNTSTGEYESIDAIAQETTDDMVANIIAAAGTKITQINAAGSTVLNSIPSDYTNLSGEVDDLKSALNETDVLISITDFTQDYYIDAQGSTADITHPSPSASGYRYTVVDCKAGDTFVVSGYGGNGPRLWCFIDADGNTLAPKATGNERATNKKITAPANTAKLIVNSRTDCTLYYKSNELNKIVDELVTKGYQAKGILPANADLNDYTEIGVYRKYTDAAYPATNMPKPVAQSDVGILAVIRGNASGSNTAILQYWMTPNKGIYFRRCNSNAWSEWTRVDQTIKNKPVLCVSTFRADVYSSSQDYYYAISYDSGVSFYELKESKGFAGENVTSSDVSLFEWNDGLVMVCTSNTSTGSQNIFDFKAVYTKDFNTYYSVKPDLGFMRKAAEYTNSPYVWSPQIFKKGNDLYIVAAVSIGDTVNGDLYNPDSTNSKTRYVYPFARKVVFTFDETNGFNIEADGNLFQLQFENDTESIQDVSLFYSSSQEKIYCAYKDRILNTINIALADDLDEEFSDIETFIGNFAYSEACYFTYISGIIYLYWCVHGLRTDVLRREFVYNVNTSGTDIHVGVVNPYHFNDGAQADMRNPCPIEISEDLFNKLAAKYNLPSSIQQYNRAEVQEYKESAILTRMSHVIYERLGKFVHIPDKYLVPISAKTGGATGDICNMCFDNPEYTAKIDLIGDTTIITPYDETPSHIIKNTANAKMYKIGYGYVHAGLKDYDEPIEPNE